MPDRDTAVERAYALARERYAELGVDTEAALAPLAAGGFTLAHPDEAVRRFWVGHGVACRRVGAHFGWELGTPCVTNVWIPDGYKDTPADRKTPRERLRRSLDDIFAEEIDPRFN